MSQIRFFALIGAVMMIAAPSHHAGAANVWTAAEFTTDEPGRCDR